MAGEGTSLVADTLLEGAGAVVEQFTNPPQF